MIVETGGEYLFLEMSREEAVIILKSLQDTCKRLGDLTRQLERMDRHNLAKVHRDDEAAIRILLNQLAPPLR